MKTPLKHKKILRKLKSRLISNKNVVGIYLLGSLAKNKANKKSDIDIEVMSRYLRI